MTNRNILINIFIILPYVVIDGNEFNTIQEDRIIKKSMNFQNRLFSNKIEKRKSRLLDNITNTIYVDGIPHTDIHKSIRRDRIDNIENGFKSMLGMKGVKYTFKRGFSWRTWRVVNEGGTGTMVSYKCKGSVDVNCKSCSNGGHWEIEEKPPPCPYEILSMPNDNQLCAIHFTQYNSIQSSCPTLINLRDLLSVCSNPIETEWRISPKYNNHQSSEMKSTLGAVCGGRPGCHITTLYTIQPDSILFKIINSSNNIIYSRVMKNNHKNFACFEDCGTIDQETKRVIKNDEPLILNLLNSEMISRKKKRAYKTENIKSKNMVVLSKHLQPLRRIVWKVTKTPILSTPYPVSKRRPIKKTLCKKLIESYTEDYSDSIDI